MYCSLCCGGGGGGGGSGDDASGDWTQYCNLHCVMVVVVVFFLKQWCIYRMGLECTRYSGCTCMVCRQCRYVVYVHGIVTVWCSGRHM